MKKCFCIKSLFLFLFLLGLQLVLPSGNALAATNSNVLPPSNLTSQLTTPDDVKLTWSSVYGAAGYNVYGITEGQLKLLGTTTSTTYSFSNLQEGSYTYVVSTLTADGESGPSAPISVSIVYPIMAAPAILTNTLQNGNDIVLNWSQSQYAQSYNIYQITADGEKTMITSVTGRAYTIVNSPEGTYTYGVSAVNSLYGESPLSTPVQVNMVFPTMAAPSNLVYKIQNGNDVVLTWGAVSYSNSYKVYELINGEEVLQTTVSSATATLTGLPNGDHTYVVHSYSDRFGKSPDGSQVSITLGAVTMSAPSDFAYKINNGNDILLTWDSMPNATSYKVYQVNNGQKTLKSTVTGTTVTYANMPAGDYGYEVYSYSTSFGESVEGSQLAFTVTFPTMEPPANVVQSIKSATSFAFSWDAAQYATSYKVYQVINGQKVLKSTVTTPTVIYTNMVPGDYTFEVHSYSTRFGESVEGSTLAITLNGQTMEAPTNLTYSTLNVNDITLKWTAAPYATSYKVYQVINGQNVLQKTVTTASATFTNMPGGNYDYVVTSVSTLLGESPSGAEVTLSLVLPTMAAPSNLAYKIQNGNSLVLTWAAATYANSYKVYELVDGQEVLKTTVTSLTATLSNVQAGDHTYVVRSVSTRFGESAERSQVTLTLEQQIMMAPTDLTYSITNGNDITLKWTAATYATSYNIYQVIDGQNILKKAVTSTSVTFANIPAGDYDYVVTSVSTKFGESPSGAEVALSLVTPAMAAPSNLAYRIQNGNYIVLTWASATYANSYKVYELVDGQEVLKTTVTSLTTTLSNVSTGDHTYVVHSVSTRFGESQEGSQISMAVDYVEMMAPSNLAQSITNGNDITLRWSAATYATAYKVYQIIDGQKSLVKTVTSASVAFTNMPAGDYSFEINSYSDRFGESAIGSTVNFTVIWPIVQPPVLKDTIYNVNNITLSWQAVTWANEYRVYEVKGDTRQLLYKGTALTYKIFNISEDTHNYEVTAYNTRFGESASSNRISETIIYPDMNSPVASLNLLDSTTASISWNFVTYANGYNVYEIIDGKSVLLTENLNNLSYQVNNLSYEDHQYYVTSFSNSFGESQPSNIVIAKLIIDTDPPVTTANAPINWINESSVVINLYATDKETGVGNTYYSINDSDFTEGTSITVDIEGVNKISFCSVDKVGNREVVQTIYVKIDKTAPVITMDLNSEYKLNDTVQLNYNAKDNLSGIIDEKMVVLEPGDTIGKVVSNGDNIQFNKPGVYKVIVIVTDAAGFSTTIEKQFVVYIPATIEVTSKVIKGNNGVFTVRVDLQSACSTQGFDLNTTTLNGVKALTSNNGYYNQAKLGQFKFERSEFSWTPSDILVEFRCYINGYLVVGQTTVKVQK
jgi:large repetitive protein